MMPYRIFITTSQPTTRRSPPATRLAHHPPPAARRRPPRTPASHTPSCLVLGDIKRKYMNEARWSQLSNQSKRSWWASATKAERLALRGALAIKAVINELVSEVPRRAAGYGQDVGKRPVEGDPLWVAAAGPAAAARYGLVCCTKALPQRPAHTQERWGAVHRPEEAPCCY